ncbi:Trp biosynthesis-associated membrane protein [Pseudonocardia saturnea]
MSPRLLGLACVGLVVSAAALWGASQAVWYRVGTTVAGRAAQLVDVTGAQARPSLGGVALLALAGIAGVVAAGGLLRRAVGGLLALAGAVVAGAAVLSLVVPPSASEGGSVTATTPAPWLAVLGGAVLLAVGLVVLVRERRLPRLGARYAAGRVGDGAARPAPTDPDRAAWQDLDAGRDPTNRAD